MASIHVTLHDPFGAVIAEGLLDIPDIIGVGQAPPLAVEIDGRLRGKRCGLQVPDYDGPGYSVSFG